MAGQPFVTESQPPVGWRQGEFPGTREPWSQQKGQPSVLRSVLGGAGEAGGRTRMLYPNLQLDQAVACSIK